MVVSAKPKQHKNIYKSHNRYYVSKRINNEIINYGSCATINEAMKLRDRVKENNWKPLPPTPEEKLKTDQYFYYHRIYLRHDKKRYYINNKNGLYIGVTKTIEEALYYRDLYSNKPDRENTPKPSEVDLITDNPYIKNGLKVPLPERLIQPPPKKTSYGTGSIRKRDNHYRIEYKGRYFTSCVTYEQADYYKKELNKRGWSKENLKQIEKDYPAYYTWLNKFYIYIIKVGDKWAVNLTPNNNGGKLEQIRFNNLEDALHERDFLIKNNWDYNLLVETIDDMANPYWDMELPPYPERKIKHLSLDMRFDDELEKLRQVIYDHPEYSQEDIAIELNVATPTIRNWLKKYNCQWKDFHTLASSGENPLDYYDMEEHIYEPDLTRTPAKHFSNYVQRNIASSTNPYRVVKDAKHYGSYPTREIANKISNELQKTGWNKENLERIRKKYKVPSKVNSKRWVYSSNKGKSWSVRRKNKDRRMIQYGTYQDKRIAELVRDMLIINNWNKNELPELKQLATQAINTLDLYRNNMFGGIRI